MLALLKMLLPFFGGTTFRMLWGEVSHFITTQQDHAHEIERMREQEKLDAAAHERNMAALRLQHELGVEVVHVNMEQHARAVEDDAFADAAAAAAGKFKSGVPAIDAWNQGIRPAGATIAFVILIVESCVTLYLTGDINPQTRIVFMAFLGLFVGDRVLVNRGK